METFSYALGGDDQPNADLSEFEFNGCQGLRSSAEC
jgi:hypothetical protein